MLNAFRFCLVFLWLLLPSASRAQSDTAVTSQSVSRKFIDAEKIRKGQSREEIAKILGNEVVVGYELAGQADEKPREYRPITVPNPYRTETVNQGSRVFVVDYYLVGINHADGQITDDELLPLVFRNDKLVGKGWDFLTRKIKR